MQIVQKIRISTFCCCQNDEIDKNYLLAVDNIKIAEYSNIELVSDMQQMLALATK